MTVNSFLAKSTIVAALGGLLFGFDTAVIAGTTDSLRSTYNLSPELLGMTVASALWGTVIGSLFAGFPGTTANRPPLNACLAPSSRSNLTVADCTDGPWHWKHLSERIGRISRLNSIVAGSGGVSCGTACTTSIRIPDSSTPNAAENLFIEHRSKWNS